MSENDQSDPKKKVPAETTDAPQEKSDADAEQEKKAHENAPPPPLDEIIRESPPLRSTDE